ncbi:hypothetical protein IFM89_026719, partial [Coptis chinensis]
QYLKYCQEICDFHCSRYVMSPPIRKLGHGKALQAALSTGTLQVTFSLADFLKLRASSSYIFLPCTFNSTQKALGIDDFRKIPNGVNGIEERMHLIWDTMVESGQISVTNFVRVTSTEWKVGSTDYIVRSQDVPLAVCVLSEGILERGRLDVNDICSAQIFNIYPRKGAILAGSDADIIIFNPNSSFKISARSHHSRSDTNVYEGRRGKGLRRNKHLRNSMRGRIVRENDELKVAPGSGKYIEMPPFGHIFSGIDRIDAAYLSSLHAPVQRLRTASWDSDYYFSIIYW